MASHDEVETETSRVVDRVYRAYLGGDPEGMLEPLADNVEVAFLGRGVYRGIDETRQLLLGNATTMKNLDFRIRKIIVDGHVAAAVWDETAETADGRPYANHGVDVFEVRDGKVAVLHENNDITRHRRDLRARVTHLTCRPGAARRRRSGRPSRRSRSSRRGTAPSTTDR